MSSTQTMYMSGLTKQLKEVLRKQEIEVGDPGPILSNVQALIDAIGRGIPTTSKYFALPQRKLDELNQRMAEPLPHAFKRPQLRSFPTLMGLFLLLRSTGLAVGETTPKRVVLIDPEMLDQWNSFNATERYMSLLECWLTTANWDSVGEKISYTNTLAPAMQQLYLRLSDKVTRLDDSRFGMLYGFSSAVTVGLLHQFGWVRLEYDSAVSEGKAASIRSIERLPFGDAMFAATCGIDHSFDVEPTRIRGLLEPFFPQWKRSLTIPEAEFRGGEHTLKISWGKVWRRLVAPSDTRLDEIAQAVLDAFKFDYDHLYQFEFRDDRGHRVCAVCSMLDDGDVFADELRLGDLPIAEGDSITMVYDFGDNWEFDIKLEAISDKPSRRSAPRVIKRSGTAPKQYSYGEWD